MPWQIEQQSTIKGPEDVDGEHWVAYLEKLLNLSLKALNANRKEADKRRQDKNQSKSKFKNFTLAFVDSDPSEIRKLQIIDIESFRGSIEKEVRKIIGDEEDVFGIKEKSYKIALLYKENAESKPGWKAAVGKLSDFDYLLQEVDAYLDDLVFSWSDGGQQPLFIKKEEVNTEILQHVSPVGCVGYTMLYNKKKKELKGKLPIYLGQSQDFACLILNPDSDIFFTDENEPFLDYRWDQVKDEPPKVVSPIEVKGGERVFFYETEDEPGIASLQVKIGSKGGGGGGAARSDSVDEVDYYWTGNKLLGIALGLDAHNKYLDPLQYPTTISVKPEESVSSGKTITLTLKDKVYSLMNIPSGITNPLRSEILYFKCFKDYDNKGVYSTENGKKKKKNKPYQITKNPLILSLQNINQAFSESKMQGFIKEQKQCTLLHGNITDRANANTVMSDALTNASQDKVSGLPNPLSATKLSKHILTNEEAQDFWSKYLDKNKLEILTDQEWCHLYGHGDGGPDVFANFVAGSKHCNTEQLAIESGQRKGKPKKLTVTVKAYLVPNDLSFEPEVPGKNDHPTTWVAPLAAFIVYEIYHNGNKIFSHCYDAQSHSFNYHEFKILKTTVERCIAEATGKLEEYKQAINARLEKLCDGKDEDEKYKYKYDPQIHSKLEKFLR